jgi:hypothetical protein
LRRAIYRFLVALEKRKSDLIRPDVNPRVIIISISIVDTVYKYREIAITLPMIEHF